MNKSGWQKFYGDNFVKAFYDIKLKRSGTIVRNCWPNAGHFNLVGKNSAGMRVAFGDVEEVKVRSFYAVIK